MKTQSNYKLNDFIALECVVAAIALFFYLSFGESNSQLSFLGLFSGFQILLLYLLFVEMPYYRYDADKMTGNKELVDQYKHELKTNPNLKKETRTHGLKMLAWSLGVVILIILGVLWALYISPAFF